jgi:hypothetical protein
MVRPLPPALEARPAAVTKEGKELAWTWAAVLFPALMAALLRLGHET